MELNELTSIISAQLGTFTRGSEQGEIPDEPVAFEFHRLCQKLQSIAPDSWYDEAEDFTHLANQLCQAIKQGRTPEAILLVDSLEDSYNYLATCF
jgi:XXXCH domain-containing protein